MTEDQLLRVKALETAVATTQSIAARILHDDALKPAEIVAAATVYYEFLSKLPNN